MGLGGLDFQFAGGACGRILRGLSIGALLAAALFTGLAQAATVQYVYDELGRLIAVIDPASEVTQYQYDDVGNLLAVTRRPVSEVSVVSFSPTRGQAGQAIAIVGAGFSAIPAENQVAFNGVAALVSAATATSLVATVPPGATTGPISVATPAGSASSTAPFIVRRPPELTSFSPTLAQPGGTLTLTGLGLDEPELAVTVNRAASEVLSTSLDTATSRVPVATGGRVTVSSPLGSSTSTDDVFIVPAPHTVADVAVTGRIEIDGASRALALSGGKVALVLFDAVAGGAGMRVTLRDSTLSGGAFSILGPNASPLAGPVRFGPGGISLSLNALPETGTYGVLIVADAAANGGVTVAAATGVADTIAVGETLLVSVAAGQVGQFTFVANAGDPLGMEVKGVTLPAGSSFNIFGPDGASIFGGSIFINPSTDTSFKLTSTAGLPLTGTYTVVVTPASGAAGVAQFTLWRDVDGGELALNTPSTVTTTYRGQQARLRFSGTAGDRLGLELKGVTMPAGSVFEIIGPNGASVLGGIAFINPSTDISFHIPNSSGLPLTGTYTVVVTPSSTAPGAAQFTLWKDVDGGELALDAPTTVGTNYRVQQARLTFSAIAGDQFGLELENVTMPAGTVFDILGPNGASLLGGVAIIGPGSDFSFRLTGPAGLPLSGTYSVVVSAQNPGSGTVQFTLWRDVDGGDLALDVPTTVGTSYREQQARLTFSATSGDRLGLEVKGVTMPAGSFFNVLGPNGASVSVGNVFIDPSTDISFRFPGTSGLPSTGNYTVAVTPVSGSGSAQFTLWKDVAAALTIGSPQAVQIVYRGQQARLTFDGAAGDSLRLSLSGVTDLAGGSYSVLRPDGISVLSGILGNVTVDIPTLSATGTHAVLLTPPSLGVGNVTVHVFNR